MIFRFDDALLDTDRREFRVAGQTRSLEPQVFDLLRYLIENRDRVVGKEELVQVVWRGRIVSDATISARINAARTAMGDTGQAQSKLKTYPRRGFRFVAELQAEEVNDTAPALHSNSQGLSFRPVQHIRLCRSADGTEIAYAEAGTGPGLVKVGNWLTHLDLDWESPVWQPLLRELTGRNRLVRYDQRGNGLSQWDVDRLSLDAFVEDLEAVIAAAGLDRFVLFGMSQGVPIALTYAARHPGRVSKLILQGGFLVGRAHRASPEEKAQAAAYLTLMRHGWGRSGSHFIHAFASLFIPDATDKQLQWLAEQQRQTTTPENAVRLRQAIDDIDVTEIVESIAIPAVVLHSRYDGIQPFEQGRLLAASLRNAEFIPLDSRNHVLLPQEPEWPRYIDVLRFHLSAFSGAEGNG